MSHQRLPNSDRGLARLRTRPAHLALIGWWAAAVLAIIAWWLLDASMTGDGGHRTQQVGIWLVGFAALGSVIGWGASIGSLVGDRGRIRAGSICLLVIPVLGLLMGWLATSSTVIDPEDPIVPLWLVASGLLLLLATLLILLPEHLGTS